MEQRHETGETVEAYRKRIVQLEEAIRPFSIAAGRVPQDAEDREKVYLNTLTAGDYRKARQAYVSKTSP